MISAEKYLLELKIQRTIWNGLSAVGRASCPGQILMSAGLTELGAVFLQMIFGKHDLKVASEKGAKSILQCVDQKGRECYKGSRKSEKVLI